MGLNEIHHRDLKKRFYRTDHKFKENLVFSVVQTRGEGGKE